MTNWLIAANGLMYDHASSFEHHSFIDWRQGSFKYEVGDIVFIYTTRPTSMIQYKCIVEKTNLVYPNIRDDKEYWNNEEEYYKSLHGKFMKLKLIDQIDNKMLSLEKLKENGLKAAPQGPVKLKPQLLEYINFHFSDNYQTDIFPEMIVEEPIEFEGIKKQIIVNKYERSSLARKKCIEFHGVNCVVCNLNFQKYYGELGKDFIHIHHLTPIHKIGKEYQIDYKKDLIPVCPNCHAMLHRKINGKEPSIEELQEIVKKQ